MALKLKAVEPQDLSWLKNHRNRKEVMDFCRQPFLLNEINQDDWLKECSRKHTMLPFMVVEDDLRVGYAAFSNIDWIAHRAECSYFISPELQGKGYGEEAIFLLLEYGFKKLNFQKIHSDTFDYNQKEIDLNKKVGFKQSGILPRHYFKRGKLIDAVLMYMFKEDFETFYKDRLSKEKNPESKPL